MLVAKLGLPFSLFVDINTPSSSKLCLILWQTKGKWCLWKHVLWGSDNNFTWIKKTLYEFTWTGIGFNSEDINMDFAFNSTCVQLLLPSYNKCALNTTLCWELSVQTWTCTAPALRVPGGDRCVPRSVWALWFQCHMEFSGRVLLDDRGPACEEGLPDAELWGHNPSLWRKELFEKSRTLCGTTTGFSTLLWNNVLEKDIVSQSWANWGISVWVPSTLGLALKGHTQEIPVTKGPRGGPSLAIFLS